MGRRSRDSESERRNYSVKQYKKDIIKMLKHDFCIHLSQEEIEHIHSIQRETDDATKRAVHNAFLTILDDHWDEENKTKNHATISEQKGK